MTLLFMLMGCKLVLILPHRFQLAALYHQALVAQVEVYLVGQSTKPYYSQPV
jgi:hypothetical protein